MADHKYSFESLFLKRPNLIKPGLDRIIRGYEYLNQPARKIPTFLIGGTNGKGSTSGFLWYLLALASKRAGLYTSPHLVHFSERIQCSHLSIDDAECFACWQKLKECLPGEIYDPMSFFEITTLLALQLFADHCCDVNVLEVGLGGRWDATNVVDPLAAIIVSVSHDHEEYLGSQLSAIAFEKLGIVRELRPLFVGSGGEMMRDEAVKLGFYAEAKARRVPIWSLGTEFGVTQNELWIRLPDLEPFSCRVPDAFADSPPFLVENFCLAAAVYYWYGLKQDRSLPSLAVLMQRFPASNIPFPVSMAGRFYRTSVERADGSRQSLILDVAHNPDGVREFTRSLSESLVKGGRQKLPALISILKDKDVNAMLDVLKDFLNPIMLFKINNERTMSLDDLEERHHDLILFDSFHEAWIESQKSWETYREFPWAICGSVMAIGKVFEYFSLQPKNLEARRVLAGDWDSKSGPVRCFGSGC